MSGEHFIPFRKTDVIAMCADGLSSAERESFLGFTRMLASLLHHQFRDRIEALKDAYHPFNPEADTRTVGQITSAERQSAQQRLEDELTALAQAANYTPMNVDELTRAAGVHSLLKVRMEINTDVIDKIIFFRRGESVRTREIPTWYGLRRETVSFTNYARVLVYAKFKDAAYFEGKDLDRLPFRPGSTVVKLFQNVPRDDLEMVFPNVQVRMRLLDKLLIGVPALISGIFVVAKLLAPLGLMLLLLGVWLGLSNREVTLNQGTLVATGAGLFALGGYLVRQVTKFKNRKISFMKSLSENLYFRNLDNDAGVFHNLLDAAEEAEVIEAVLAYHFLRTAAAPLSAAELDAAVETWFTQRWEAQFDFEVHDGLRKLRELGLVAETADGHLSATPLAEAKQHMDRLWDDVFDYSHAAPAETALTAMPAQRSP
jgi:hypothetical protein